MARIERQAEAVWEGNIARGEGSISGASGVLSELAYDVATRVSGRASGKTSPEELVAAAHSGCYAMSLANELSSAGTPPGHLEVQATVVMEDVPGKGHVIVASNLVVHATVPEIGEEAFQAAVRAADEGCPLSMLIRGTAEVTVDATLD